MTLPYPHLLPLRLRLLLWGSRRCRRYVRLALADARMQGWHEGYTQAMAAVREEAR